MRAIVRLPATGLQATKEMMSARKTANAVAGLENFIIGRRRVG